MPASRSSSRIPNCAMPSIIAFCSGFFGNNACCTSGSSRPKREGPSSRPAISWPITEGWRSRDMTSPSKRPTSMSTTSWAMKIASDAPLPLSAARPGSPKALPARTAKADRDGFSWRRPCSGLWRQLRPKPQYRPQAPDNSVEFEKFHALCNCKLFATRYIAMDRRDFSGRSRCMRAWSHL